MEETRAHLRRRASPVEAHFRQRRRGKRWGRHTRCGRLTTVTNTASRSTRIRWSIPMTNSGLFGRPSRMTPNILSAEAKLYPILPYNSQSSFLPADTRMPNYISRQAITRSATEHDFIRPRTTVHSRTRVHPPQFVPYAPGVL